MYILQAVLTRRGKQMPLRKLSTVNYAEGTIPEDYKCDDCGASGVKLWREYQVRADVTGLQCASCAEVRQKECHSHVPEWVSSFKLGEDDWIGFSTPALPIEGKNGFWGIGNTPQAAWDWWDKLPTQPQKA